MSLTEDGVTVQGPKARTEIQWDAFSGLAETGDTLLLRYAAARQRTAVVLPKRAFGPEQAEELRAFMARRGAVEGLPRS
ncbi:YcxB family protein [Streptacidiphilus anmyonensis]|uniref:YcxB family protein n=1 Tax=Streptacidiphilus anmyonensis TaxID=405782 RepID=UPI0005A6243A|nr:YcxB family protein [Streptacidiphilus anmyonensis]